MARVSIKALCRQLRDLDPLAEPETTKQIGREAADEIERLAQPRWGEAGYVPPEPILHAFNPHPKWPWFCKDCGYPPHERLKHTQADRPTDTTPNRALDGERG